MCQLGHSILHIPSDTSLISVLQRNLICIFFECLSEVCDLLFGTDSGKRESRWERDRGSRTDSDVVREDRGKEKWEDEDR